VLAGHFGKAILPLTKDTNASFLQFIFRVQNGSVPLVTVKFPGVMTPVPPVKTAIRLAVPPAVTAVGLAAKLVIVGAEPEDPPLKELHSVRLAKDTKRTNAR